MRKNMPMLNQALRVVRLSGIFGPPLGSNPAKPMRMIRGILKNVTIQSSVRNFFICYFDIKEAT
jgi:hypothetical protein